MYACTYKYVHIYFSLCPLLVYVWCLQRPKESVASPGAGVPGSVNCLTWLLWVLRNQLGPSATVPSTLHG